QRLVRRARDDAAIAAEVTVACQDDARAPRQRPPDGIPGAATHDHGLPHRDGAHMLHVVGEPPGEVVVLPDRAIAVVRDDEGDRHGFADHTAILASIGGWNWACSRRAIEWSSGPGFWPAFARAMMSR